MVKTEKTEDVKQPSGAIKKTANINIRPYSNLLIEYNDINDLNADEILNDILFFNDIIIANESLSKANGTTPAPVAQKIDIPDGYSSVTECPKCGSKSLTLKTGNGKNGVWYAVDCADCKSISKSDGKEYPTRTFLNKIDSKTVKKSAPVKNAGFDDDFDEYDTPF